MNMVKRSFYKENNTIKVFYEPLIDKYIINLNQNHDNRINYYYPKVVADKIFSSCNGDP